MDWVKDDSGQTATLRLDGELTVQRASELKGVLLDAQEGVERLFLNLEGVTGADVSGLQLLCSAHRSAVKSNKCLSVTDKASAPFVKAVRDAGYEREQGCPFDPGQTCLWRRG